jgi:hypothetical protein
MPRTPQRRWERAVSDTHWFKLRTDILPSLAVGVFTGLGATWISSRDRGFQVSEVWIPVVFGIAGLLVYFAISNGLEFAWHYAVAGYKNEIDDLKNPALRVKRAVRFDAPFQIEDPAMKGKSILYRIPIYYESIEDQVGAEAHFSPRIQGQELVRPAMHLSQRVVPTPWMGTNPITLRHGQTAYIDLAGFDKKGEKDQNCYAIDEIKFTDGTFRESITLPANDYQIRLRILYSDKPHDEKTYRLKVDGGDEPLTLTEEPGS